MTVPRFWRHISARYNLTGTRCKSCGECYFPPRTTCPVCRRDGKITEYRFKGTGEVVTYTVVYSASDRFNKQTPYVLAIIKLEEGPQLTGQVICGPAEIQIGMKVRSVFRKLGEDRPEGIIYYGTKFIPAGRDLK
ncbi:MAG: Zn-ribbon domain-containing OB-fold protein [Methanocellales archaeon]|nr:Zn-ribbon domain-containing OB-fold protein [Methanocellales archaeon]